MATNRRKFIATSSLGFFSLSIFSNTSLKISSFLFDNKPTQTIPQLLREAALKRRNGELTLATNIYNQVIALDSNEIRAYDGLRKVLLQNKYKELEVLQLYSTALNQNPTNLVLKERVAKEYMRLALGNTKYVNQLNSQEDLLELSKAVFLQLKNNEPTNIQYDEQFVKAERKLLQQANVVDARQNLDLKNYRKTNKTNFKKRFKNLDVATLENKLSDLLSKPVNQKRAKYIRELYIILIKKYSKNNNPNKVIQKLNAFYQYNTSDVNTLRLARRMCKKHSRLNALENFERLNDTAKNTFWSKIALIDILLRRYKKDGTGNPSEIQNLLNTALTLRFRPNHYFEVNSRKFKLSIFKGNESEAKNNLLVFADSISGISSAHYIDRFNLLCVRYFKKFNKNDKALQTIRIALMETNKAPEDEILKIIFEINKNKALVSKPIHNQRLNEIKIKLMSNQLD